MNKVCQPWWNACLPSIPTSAPSAVAARFLDITGSKQWMEEQTSWYRKAGELEGRGQRREELVGGIHPQEICGVHLAGGICPHLRHQKPWYHLGPQPSLPTPPLPYSVFWSLCPAQLRAPGPSVELKCMKQSTPLIRDGVWMLNFKKNSSIKPEQSATVFQTLVWQVYSKRFKFKSQLGVVIKILYQFQPVSQRQVPEKKITSNSKN